MINPLTNATNSSSSEEIKNSLELISQFQQSPLALFERYWNERNRPSHQLTVSDSDQRKIVSSLPKVMTDSAKLLSENLDKKNLTITMNLPTTIQSGSDIVFNLKPIRRIGIYVPHRLPSTAFTFLSAAKAAGVSQFLVYLAEGSDGLADPLSVFCARLYGAKILSGPARFAFPTLALGIEQLNIKPVDLVCGPCGNSLNILKQISGIVGQVSTDMWAGSSELAILVDSTANFNQVEKDMLAQIEHGPHSLTHVLSVGEDAHHAIKKIYDRLLPDKQKALKLYGTLPDFETAVEKINELAPETTEIWIGNPDSIEKNIVTSGVVYAKNASSLGDYAVIGRGCADPTSGLARSQSGLSPMLFMRHQAYVRESSFSIELLNAGENLADYERLVAHKNAIALASNEIKQHSI